MATPTTWRGEYDRANVPLNRRDFLTLSTTQAGSSAKNPIQAGLGITFRVRVTGLPAANIGSIVGRMILMVDSTEATGGSFTFTQDPADPQIYEAEGAAGGDRLGFLSCLNYDHAIPYELELTVTYRGGTFQNRYALWIGNGEISFCEPCDERTTFAVTVRNCCFNGRGYRANSAIPGLNGHTVSLFGEFGEWDYFFDPNDGPEFAGWSFGIDDLAGGILSLECNIDRRLLNPYLPDSITGSDRGLPDDPFSLPTTEVEEVGTRAQLSRLGRVEHVTDGTEDEIGAHNFPVDAGSPADLIGTAFADPPGFIRLSPTNIGGSAPTRPDATATDRTGAGGDPGGIRSFISAQWTANDGSALATPNLISLADFPAAAPPRLQISMSGFDPGDSVFFFVSPLLPDFSGPGSPPLLPAQATAATFQATPWILQPRTNPLARTRSPLFTTLGIDGRAAPNVNLAPFSITGSPVWSNAAIGGSANFGGAGSPPQSFTFLALVDTTHLANVLAGFGAAGLATLASVPLYIQGIVFPFGTGPLPTNGASGVGTNTRFGVDPVHGSTLTTVSTIYFRS